MSEPDIYYLVQLRASAIEQSKKASYTWMSPEHVIRLLDAFEEQRARNAKLVAVLDKARKGIAVLGDTCKHLGLQAGQDAAARLLIEIDDGLAAAGHEQGGGK